MLTDDHPAIARVAWAPIAALSIAAALVAREGGFAAAWPWLLGAALVAWKFRDTDREVPPGGRAVLAPVDGWVWSAHETVGPDGTPQWRVRLIIDPFSLYSVRAPIEGQVLDPGAPGGPGRGLWLRDDEGREVALRLMAPLGLGRPVATVALGDRVGQGARCGWLRAGLFASVRLPIGTEIPRRRLRRVWAAETPLGHWPEAPSDASP